MRVIERGEDPKDLEYEMRCKNCHTRFAFKKTDVSEDPRGEGTSVTCPICKTSLKEDYSTPIKKIPLRD